MKDPCQWCDGKTAWNGSEWVQMSRCKEEDYCEYYQQYIRQQEEKDFWQSELEHGAIKPGIYANDILEDINTLKDYEFEFRFTKHNRKK